MDERVSTLVRWSFAWQGNRAVRSALMLFLVTCVCYLPASQAVESRVLALVDTPPPLVIPFSETSVHQLKKDPKNPKLIRITQREYKRITGPEKLKILDYEMLMTWCGERLLLFLYRDYRDDYDPPYPWDTIEILPGSPPAIGMFLADTATGRMYNANELEAGEKIYSCSPDGRWLIYFVREGEKNDSWVRWGRYDLQTGKKEIFVRLRVTRDNRYIFSALDFLGWSPDSTKLLFMFQGELESQKTGEPIWNIFWQRREEAGFGFWGWTNDSSAIAVTRVQEISRETWSEMAFDQTGDPQTPLTWRKLEFKERIDAPRGSYAQTYVSFDYRTNEWHRLRLCQFDSVAAVCQNTPVLKDDPLIETIYAKSLDGRIVYFVMRKPPNVGKRPDYNLKECLWRFDGRQSKCIWRGYALAVAASPSGNRIAMRAEQLSPWSNKNFTRGFAILDVVK